ncbi:MAG TPA: exodeoxyribonuclease VII large subunit [Steroidobacteraceae bacterium]
MAIPLRSPTQPPDREIYSVARLNREVRLLLERGLSVIWVEAEISNLAQPSSGHWYFSLKDRDAQVRCAMFRQRNSGVRFRPRDGQLVLARGRVGLYEPRGEYQLIVEHLEEAGVGALQREFERLKQKLAAEGLFDAARKRPLPLVPRRIGVITSSSGAAVRDILHVLRRRFPPAEVIIYPTAVQGAAAVPEIIAALERAAQRAECDVLILARGGGSLEDLWAFNDERVARAIVAAPIPVVTGIGHEVDFTIADFVADLRAPTPSGAAELVVPDRGAWLESLGQLAQRFAAAMRRKLGDERQRLATLRSRLRIMHPGVRLAQHAQRLDDLEQRLAGAVSASWQRERSRLHELLGRLLRHAPGPLLRDVRARHEALAERLRHALAEHLARAEQRLALAQRTLAAVSPLATLTRGFAIVTRAGDGTLVTDAATLAPGAEVDTRLARGRFRARVLDRQTGGDDPDLAMPGGMARPS